MTVAAIPGRRSLQTTSHPRMEKTIRKFTSHEDLRLFQLKTWQQQPTEVINDNAWQMVVEYREMMDIKPYEPRLQRHVTAVRRSRG